MIQKLTDGGYISPSAVKVFFELRTGNRKTEARLAQILLLYKLCHVESYRRVLLVQGLASALAAVLEARGNYSANDELKTQLLKEAILKGHIPVCLLPQIVLDGKNLILAICELCSIKHNYPLHLVYHWTGLLMALTDHQQMVLLL